MSAALLGLGALVAADRTAVGQTLLAHPGVAAPLAGWLAGAPAEGVWLGLALTVLTAPHLPVGRENLRDHASVAVAVPLAVGGEAGPGAWGLALMLGLLLAPAAALPIQGIRELARRALGRCRREAAAGKVPAVEAMHFGLAGLHLLRGALTVALLALFLRASLTLLEGAGPTERRLFSLLWVAAPAAGIPLLLRARWRRGGAPWLAAGLVAGAALLWWVRGGGPWTP